MLCEQTRDGIDCLLLVAAAALVTPVLVMAVATAGSAMLVDVLMIMSMAVAGGLAVLCERAGNESLDAGIAAALGARIDRDAAGHAAVVVAMGEYAILPPSMTSARPLTSAFATLRCARLLIAATVARAMPMCRATAS